MRLMFLKTLGSGLLWLPSMALEDFDPSERVIKCGANTGYGKPSRVLVQIVGVQWQLKNHSRFPRKLEAAHEIPRQMWEQLWLNSSEFKFYRIKSTR